MRRTIRMPKADYPQLTPLWIAVFIDILGFSLLIPFLPFFSQEYGAPPWQIGLLLSTNALFGFVSGPIWGALSDVRGRKPMLLISQVGTLIAFIMLAFSSNLTMLFISRVVDGIFGGNVPIAKAMVGDVAAPKDRSKEMSNIGVAHVLSSLIGPGLGGVLSQWGIIAPGLFSAALTCVTIVVTIIYLKESNPVAKRSPSQQALVPEPGKLGLGKRFPAKGDVAELPSTGLSSAGLSSAGLPSAGLPSAGLPSAGLQPAGLPVAHESIWKNGTARHLLLQWGFHTFSFMLYISCVSLFAYLKLGLDAAQVGRLLMLAGIVRVFIRFVIFIPLLKWLGDRKTSLVGLMTFVIVFPLLGLVENQVQFAAVLCVVSFAASCTRSILTGFLSRSVKPTELGRAMGLSTSLDSFARIIGPVVGGFILGSLPLWMYGGLAGIFALGALLMHFRPIEFEHEKRQRILQGVE